MWNSRGHISPLCVVRAEGPPIVYLQVGAALLHLIYGWSPIVWQIEYMSDYRPGYRCNLKDSFTLTPESLSSQPSLSSLFMMYE